MGKVADQADGNEWLTSEKIKAFYEITSPTFWNLIPLKMNPSITSLLIGLTLLLNCSSRSADQNLQANQPDIQNGDIIFQISKSSQSKAIQLATNSRYSHMGIIYKRGGKYFVYEAVQPVQLTPLRAWIKRGDHGHFVIKRLKHADELLSKEVLTRLRQVGETYKGKPYDVYFEWSDERIYCSELVWKMYKHAAQIEIGKLERLSDFDLTSPLVQAKLKERYGDHIPLHEKVISPVSMFNSDKLITVAKN